MRLWMKWIGILIVVSSLLIGVLVALNRTPKCYPDQLSCYDFPNLAFDGVRRDSFYVDLPNGNRLAVDLIQPTQKGRTSPQALPVLLTQTPYNRAARLVADGRIVDSTLIKVSGFQRTMLGVLAHLNGGEYVADQTTMMPWLGDLVRSGYVIVAADVAGTGASYGTPHVSASGYVEDSAMLLDWIDDQAWSNGNVGVFGQSYSAFTAYTAIASGHQSVKAAFVSAPPFDFYSSAGYPGGLHAEGFSANYVALTSDLDAVATPVDDDTDGNEMRVAFVVCLRKSGPCFERGSALIWS